MKDHSQYADSLALYAMDALDDQQELADLKSHLGTCGECRRELNALRSDMAMLALSATGPQPPQRARQRLMQAVAGEPRMQQSTKSQVVVGRLRPRWLTLAPMAMTLVLAVLSIVQLSDLIRMRHRVDRLQAALENEKQNSAHAKEVLAMLNDPTAVHMTLVSAQTHAEPQVKTVYKPQEGHILLIANALKPIPEDKVYELWLIPMSGGAPMPAGTFRINPSGGAMMMHAMETPGIEAKAFAVTIEPVGGSKTPTMPIVLAPAG